MNPVSERIACETHKSGVITFARFMQLALYCPDCGYYEKEGDSPGRHGDFFTSVSVGNLFGHLLACQFAEWLGAPREASDRMRIVEAGAHDGKLAEDILLWLRERRPALHDRVEYVIVEPSPRRRGWQERRLAGCGDHLRWIDGLAELPGQSVRGVIFSNELLDAMPVHRFGWDGLRKEWFEWGVCLKDGQFRWERMPPAVSRCPPPVLPDALLNLLPDGFIAEACPAAEAWWREAAGALGNGRLLTIDFGLSAEEFLLPERARGTLRAYRRHHATADLLADPGEQDLTAHVNFTAIQSAGEAAGLRTEAITTQARFLTQIAERIWRRPAGFGAWTPDRTRQFQTLTHPEHLGRPFRVLIQSRD